MISIARTFNYGLGLAGLTIPLSIAYLAFRLPHRGFAIALGLAAAAILIARTIHVRSFIDNKLDSALGGLDGYAAYSRTFPDYRFVDLNRAVSAIAQELGGVLLESQHNESLSDILNRNFFNDEARTVRTPEMGSRQIDQDTEGFFALDGFWVIDSKPDASRAVIRVRKVPYTENVTVEVAARSAEAAERLIEAVTKQAKEQSIYRMRTIEAVFVPGIRDSDGDFVKSEAVDIVFREPSRVTQDDLILPDLTREVVERNVVRFHEERESLMNAGIPGKKGVLFFGPPGTGKTYTCKYLAQRLQTTTIVAAGHALLHVKSICNIARMLQPALVILEDVDLVFSDRDLNPFSTSLGELMDELDGFGDEDALIFVLTTNSIARVESAIKDRPGRISQCVEFDYPAAGLRERYLRNILDDYDYESVSLERQIKMTQGASQAFIKELAFRAVQFSIERDGGDGRKITLSDGDFELAFEELARGGGREGKAIIGFASHDRPESHN